MSSPSPRTARPVSPARCPCPSPTHALPTAKFLLENFLPLPDITPRLLCTSSEVAPLAEQRPGVTAPHNTTTSILCWRRAGEAPCPCAGGSRCLWTCGAESWHLQLVSQSKNRQLGKTPTFSKSLRRGEPCALPVSPWFKFNVNPTLECPWDGSMSPTEPGSSIPLLAGALGTEAARTRTVPLETGPQNTLKPNEEKRESSARSEHSINSSKKHTGSSASQTETRILAKKTPPKAADAVLAFF